MYLPVKIQPEINNRGKYIIVHVKLNYGHGGKQESSVDLSGVRREIATCLSTWSRLKLFVIFV